MPLARWLVAMTVPRLIVGLLCLTGPMVHEAYGGSTAMAMMGFVFCPLTTLGLAATEHWHGAIEGLWLVGVVIGAWIDFFLIGHAGSAWVATRRKRKART